MAENDIKELQQENSVESNQGYNPADEVIAENIEFMKDANNYEEFGEGSFPNVPNMRGYVLTFQGFNKYEVYLILNTAEGFEYENPLIEEDGKIIMIINIESLDYFLENIEQYAEPITEVLQEYAYKDDIDDRELPYGYVRDENGQIKIDPIEAATVKKIFKEYPNWKSIRKVAALVKSDYSFVHDILHDARYAKMPIQIVPDIDIRRAFQVIQKNRKNNFNKRRRYSNTWNNQK